MRRLRVAGHRDACLRLVRGGMRRTKFAFSDGHGPPRVLKIIGSDILSIDGDLHRHLLRRVRENPCGNGRRPLRRWVARPSAVRKKSLEEEIEKSTHREKLGTDGILVTLCVEWRKNSLTNRQETDRKHSREQEPIFVRAV